jgi:hypothetical protein
LRSGSGAASEGAAPAPRRAVRKPAAKAASVALVTSAKKSKRGNPKKRRHLERFVPEQRHLFGDDRAVKLPCPGSKK